MIKKIKIVGNDNKICKKITEELKQKLIKNKYKIVETKPDLIIGVGGDGSFLRMVKEEQYDSKVLYVGINAGTLGFLQEIKMDDIDLFIEALNKENYKVERVGIQETEIHTKEKIDKYYSLNEIVIREKDLNTCYLNIEIDEANLENFVGDGILISTSVGSTAYNLSFGGSIVFNTLHTLQITPIAPLNSKSYRDLLNSVIVPENMIVTITPNKRTKDLIFSIDGDNFIYNEVTKINTYVKSKRIRCLRLENYNFFNKINDKFLRD